MCSSDLQPDPAFDHYVLLTKKIKNKHFLKVSDKIRIPYKPDYLLRYAYLEEKLYPLSGENENIGTILT